MKVKSGIEYENSRTGRKFKWTFVMLKEKTIISELLSFISKPLVIEMFCIVVRIIIHIMNGSIYYANNRFFCLREEEWILIK